VTRCDEYAFGDFDVKSGRTRDRAVALVLLLLVLESTIWLHLGYVRHCEAREAKPGEVSGTHVDGIELGDE
jgi:hypothetical protein